MTHRHNDSDQARADGHAGAAAGSHAALDAGCSAECFQRFERAAAVENEPYADPDLARWKAADQALTRLLAGWAEHADAPDDAFDRWFRGGQLALHMPAEALLLMEWTVLGYRPTRAAATVAEQRIGGARLRDAALEALARAAICALPALLRVVGVEAETSLTLEPVFPAGPTVQVQDRGIACIAEVGGLLAGRTYAAGPFHLLRPVAALLGPGHEPTVLRRLERARRSLEDGFSSAEELVFLSEPGSSF